MVADALSRSIEETRNSEVIYSQTSANKPGSLLALSIPINSLIEQIKLKVARDHDLLKLKDEI